MADRAIMSRTDDLIRLYRILDELEASSGGKRFSCSACAIWQLAAKRHLFLLRAGRGPNRQRSQTAACPNRYPCLGRRLELADILKTAAARLSECPADHRVNWGGEEA